MSNGPLTPQTPRPETQPDQLYTLPTTFTPAQAVSRWREDIHSKSRITHELVEIVNTIFNESRCVAHMGPYDGTRNEYIKAMMYTLGCIAIQLQPEHAEIHDPFRTGVKLMLGAFLPKDALIAWEDANQASDPKVLSLIAAINVTAAKLREGHNAKLDELKQAITYGHNSELIDAKEIKMDQLGELEKRAELSLKLLNTTPAHMVLNEYILSLNEPAQLTVSS